MLKGTKYWRDDELNEHDSAVHTTSDRYDGKPGDRSH
jgi:hypothetical protein